MEHTWFARLEAERRAGNLTRAERDVLSALGRLLAMGDHCPSEARLASEAGCARRSVQRAKARARELGLLAWERRFAGAGLRRELPCAYRAETPAQPVVRRERQRGGVQGKKRRSVEAQIAALPKITPDLLELWARRRAMRAGLPYKGQGTTALVTPTPP